MRCGETFASDGYVPFFDCVDSFMGVYIYINIYIYIYTHTHTHTHIYIFISELSQTVFLKYVRFILSVLIELLIEGKNRSLS